MSGNGGILFVADAGANVGGGHVMRCLTLAEAVTRAGGLAAFAATPAALGVLDTFARAPLEILTLEGELSAGEIAAAGAKAASAWGAGWIVADHYGFGPADDAALAAAAPNLMILDDLRRRHAVGVVLDSNIGRRDADYPGREVLAGPRYAPVRTAFVAQRAGALERRALGEPLARVLVSLGLADTGAITARVVRALLPVLGVARIDAVVGREAPSRAELAALAESEPRLTLHVDTRDMAALTAAADISVGAGGSSVWERCCLALPSLAVIIADNQRENTLALAREGAALAVAPPSGDFDARLREAYEKLAADAALRAQMSASAAALCDGLGAARVADRLLSA
jgi:UDP-2,4-diacetamido-2,4,6-trideoxy-beta-L-altropyranose hydrolase